MASCEVFSTLVDCRCFRSVSWFTGFYSQLDLYIEEVTRVTRATRAPKLDHHYPCQRYQAHHRCFRAIGPPFSRFKLILNFGGSSPYLANKNTPYQSSSSSSSSTNRNPHRTVLIFLSFCPSQPCWFCSRWTASGLNGRMSAKDTRRPSLNLDIENWKETRQSTRNPESENLWFWFVSMPSQYLTIQLLHIM